MITEHIEDLAGNRLGQIAKDLGISVKEVQEMSDVIKSLEPKPGRQFAGQTETRYIVPDVFVEKTEEGYSVTTNDTSIPKLMVSSYYEKVLRESGNDEKLNEYLSDFTGRQSHLGVSSFLRHQLAVCARRTNQLRSASYF